MKITRNQLRKIIKEEAADCLKDYRLGGMTYQEYKDCLKRFGDIESQGGGYGGGGSRYPRYRKKTSYVGVEANQELIAAVQNALAAKPNNFLSSILTQLQGGRGLSAKQKSIVKRIVSKHDSAAASLFENKIRITRRQLRRVIKEGIDIINNETGELLVFEDDWESQGGTAPEAAARDALRRLRITPLRDEPSDDPDVTDIYVEPSDWAVLDVEFEGKRRHRRSKRERERLDIDNLLTRAEKWGIEAGMDYEADNPDTDMQGVARDLAASAKYSFEQDEWDDLVWHFDNEESDLIDFIADSIVG